ncbi:MAG TPA: hypothetical protein VGE07_08455 [Herpetosiphonaceae bacterium]
MYEPPPPDHQPQSLAYGCGLLFVFVGGAIATACLWLLLAR